MGEKILTSSELLYLCTYPNTEISHPLIEEAKKVKSFDDFIKFDEQYADELHKVSNDVFNEIFKLKTIIMYKDMWGVIPKNPD